MKKLLISLLIGTTIVFAGCSNEKSIISNYYEGYEDYNGEFDFTDDEIKTLESALKSKEYKALEKEYNFDTVEVKVMKMKTADDNDYMFWFYLSDDLDVNENIEDILKEHFNGIIDVVTYDEEDR